MLLLTPLLVLCALISIDAIVDYAHRAPDDYQLAAAWLANHVPHSERVVATGYLYLPAIVSGRDDALAFPSEQAIHPGWRALPKAGEQLPQAPFVWIGERRSPELAILQRTRRLEPLYVNQRAMVARIR